MRTTDSSIHNLTHLLEVMCVCNSMSDLEGGREGEREREREGKRERREREPEGLAYFSWLLPRMPVRVN